MYLGDVAIAVEFWEMVAVPSKTHYSTLTHVLKGPSFFFSRECLVFVFCQCLELNCIFSFRYDLDKQCFLSRSPCSAKHSCALENFGVQVYKTKHLLRHCPSFSRFGHCCLLVQETWTGPLNRRLCLPFSSPVEFALLLTLAVGGHLWSTG